MEMPFFDLYEYVSNSTAGFIFYNPMVSLRDNSAHSG